MISMQESIKFSGISFSDKKHVILANVHGELRPKRLTAVLGASGSGKTTLLKIISGRLACKNKRVMMGHYNLSRRALLEISAFVQQVDVLPQYETVGEAIAFSRMLRNRDYAMEDLDDLGLAHVADSAISTLSAGEKKRLSVALELVSSPHVICLDEPISGADCKMALSIVKHLKRLCQTKTVFMSVHQPSSDIFFEFDDILVLKDGRTVFYGATNDVFAFFKSLGLTCPNFSNPADFLFLHALPLCAAECGSATSDDVNFETNVFLNKNKVPLLDQFALVYKRTLRKKMRNEFFGGFFLFGMIFGALLIGLMFFGLSDMDEPARAKNTVGLLNFCSMSFLFTSSLAVLSSLYEDAQLFSKEYQSGYYKIVPYFFARIVNDAVLSIAGPIGSCAIIAVLARLDYTFAQFAIFAANTILTTLIGQSIGLLCSILFPSMASALLVLPLAMLFQAVMNGVLVDSSALFPVFKFVEYASPFKHSFNVLVKNTDKHNALSLWTDSAFLGIGASICVELAMAAALLLLSLALFWTKANLRLSS